MHDEATLLEYVPPLQVLQDDAPMPDTEPDEHDVHVEAPSFEYVPAPQVLQEVIVPPLDAVPALHVAQVEPDRYFPAKQVI